MAHGVSRPGRSTTGMLMVMALLGGGVIVSAASPASAATPPTEKVVIDVVTVKGSGCRKDTATVAISPDNEAFTVNYSEYLAQVGLGAKHKESRKDCKITIRMSIPRGFTSAIAQADYRGFALLEPGATALQRATYRVQGGPERTFVEHPFAGPYDGFWQTTDVTDADSLVFGQCGKSRSVTIDTELRVDAGTSDTETTNSLIVMDSTDGVVTTLYRLVWKTC